MKYLILTATSGNGHNNVAKLIKNEILLKQPDAEIKIADVYYEYGKKLDAFIRDGGYLWACNRHRRLYNMFFKYIEKRDLKNSPSSRSNRQCECILYNLLKDVLSFKPDVIFSTYYGATMAIANLRRIYNLPAKIVTIALDYGISPYWGCSAKGVDMMFLPSVDMIPEFVKRRYSEEELKVVGLPKVKISRKLSKEQAKEELGLNPNIFTLTIMKSGFFPMKNSVLVRELEKIKQPIQIVIMNGKDEKCKEDLDKRFAKVKTKHKIVNLNFVDDPYVYRACADLVISKAGGQSITELIDECKPMLIVNKLPRQEEFNRDYAVRLGCALSVGDKTLGNTINELITNNQKLEGLGINASKVQKSQANDAIVDYLMSLGNADYSQFNINDNARQVIRLARKTMKKYA